MMLLHRYIFISVLFSSVAAVGLFVFVLLTGNALRDIIGLLAAGRLSWSMFFELLLLLVPYVFSYAMPLGILTGILIVLGRLSAQREIVALKSAGLSVWHLAAPIFAVALIGVVVSSFINNYYAPNAKIRYRTMLLNVVREDPLRFVRVGAPIHEFAGYVLYVGSKAGNSLEDFWIWELDGNHRATKLLRARKGELAYDEDSDALVLTLQEGFLELRNQRNPDDLSRVGFTASFKEARIRLPLDHILGKRRAYTSLSALNLGALLRRKSEYSPDIEQFDHLPEAKDGQRSKSDEDRVRVQFQIQRNFAMAFSIISLAFIGVPLGIRVGHRETYANLALALFLALAYYFLIIAVGWFEKQPALRPDLLIWLPNFVFQVCGLWMIVRANRV